MYIVYEGYTTLHENPKVNIKILLFSLTRNIFIILGIFAYLNYLTPKTRLEVLDLLVNGLKRLEYRGYDSTGVAIDSADSKDIVMIKCTGKVKVLEDSIAERMAEAFCCYS